LEKDRLARSGQPDQWEKAVLLAQTVVRDQVQTTAQEWVQPAAFEQTQAVAEKQRQKTVQY
jgi:hypothetical protein